jgi:glutamine synthetase
MLSSLTDLAKLLEKDDLVRVAGVDVDGVLRGKTMSKEKFLSIVKTGFGFSSCIFQWDMHDESYDANLDIGNRTNGNRDILAIPDIATFRRIPWENNAPFFFVTFALPEDEEAAGLDVCPRTLVRMITKRLSDANLEGKAGGIFFAPLP